MQIASHSTPQPIRTKLGKPTLRSTAGLTIVEVMLAGCVLVFSLCSAFLVLQKGYQAIDTARNGSIAAQIMQSEIERIRLLDWTTVEGLAGLAPSLDVTSAFPANSKVTNRFTTFRRNVTVDGTRKVADIELTVGWVGFDGASHSRAFKARYSKNGLYDFYYTRARS